ncbi:hypothetical protein NAP1_15263 [Erythrobacter sp. NAP1]|uniref:DUF2155 domain-containing protein n=1 Tax=Erythrobacter sp. NAP1 TaxID=237727 RepID=UPI0000687620|nr:DUF2155 domain-containing protein [Erythrobacter sp. NAP1]EAQ28970.1 hypothetical protein NAP1_15263 [Erythrobacter sp. NAP1]
MHARFALLAILPTFALAACGEEESEPEAASVEETAEEIAGPDEAPALTPLEVGESTPMDERVATIGLLNKRNNVSQDLELSPGETAEVGPVIVRLEACERTAPYEFPQETGAFVQVDVLERGASEHARIFSGWLFKENPSLNVVEHPIYDVWVKDCAMSFPGDE